MHAIAILALAAATVACGGSGGADAITTPSEPRALTANVGNGAVSLGWAPVASDGGAAVQGYEIAITPQTPAATVAVIGRRALVRGLGNGTTYSFSVRARNSAGLGSAAQTAAISPADSDTNQYQPLLIAGDQSPSGIFDPALLRTGPNELWMSYSSVHYYRNGSNQLVQDVGIQLARSTDNGLQFQRVVTIATPGPATVTDTDAGLTACGSPTCVGRWVYETSWLVADPSDPDPAARYKLFAHKYFLSPGAASPTLYHLGTIVMWTAADPAGPWSAETSVLGWNLTPPELSPRTVVNSLATAVADCLVVTEGSAVVRGNQIDLVFACPYLSGNSVVQKIVLLRSVDHLASIAYVATILEPADAAPLGASYYSAPAVLANEDGAPVLLVTPAVGAGIYAGCVVFPFADENTGTLFRQAGVPLAIQGLPTRAGRFGGACAWARGAT
ncbi:MAG: fibronectin type III domain-containing protein, partial [Gammaproteobacteria bacterium]